MFIHLPNKGRQHHRDSNIYSFLGSSSYKEKLLLPGLIFVKKVAAEEKKVFFFISFISYFPIKHKGKISEKEKEEREKGLKTKMFFSSGHNYTP